MIDEQVVMRHSLRMALLLGIYAFAHMAAGAASTWFMISLTYALQVFALVYVGVYIVLNLPNLLASLAPLLAVTGHSETSPPEVNEAAPVRPVDQAEVTEPTSAQKAIFRAALSDGQFPQGESISQRQLHDLGISRFANPPNAETMLTWLRKQGVIDGRDRLLIRHAPTPLRNGQGGETPVVPTSGNTSGATTTEEE